MKNNKEIDFNLNDEIDEIEEVSKRKPLEDLDPSVETSVYTGDAPMFGSDEKTIVLNVDEELDEEIEEIEEIEIDNTEEHNNISIEDTEEKEFISDSDILDDMILEEMPSKSENLKEKDIHIEEPSIDENTDIYNEDIDMSEEIETFDSDNNSLGKVEQLSLKDRLNKSQEKELKKEEIEEKDIIDDILNDNEIDETEKYILNESEENIVVEKEEVEEDISENDEDMSDFEKDLENYMSEEIEEKDIIDDILNDNEIDETEKYILNESEENIVVEKEEVEEDISENDEDMSDFEKDLENYMSEEIEDESEENLDDTEYDSYVDEEDDSEYDENNDEDGMKDDDEEEHYETIEDSSEEEYDGYYDDEELLRELEEESGKKNKKTTIIKVIIGIIAIVLIVFLSIYIRNFINEVDNSSLTDEITTVPTPSPEVIETDSEDLNIEELEEETEEVSEVSDVSFMKTLTGYVIDINENDIYVSDTITKDELNLLQSEFSSFMNDTDIKVYINEDSENKVYYTEKEEGFKEVSLSDLSEDYKAFNDDKINVNRTSLDFDYSDTEDLALIEFKKFTIENENLPSFITIGTSITVSYTSNSETLLNDVVDIQKGNLSDESFGIDVETNTEENKNKNENVSVFGSEFDSIIAIINARDDDSSNDVMNEVLTLANEGTRETVSSKINISACEYAWIQILWKKNSDTKSIPEVEDVAVELQTPSGSLVTESNLSSYGTKWVNKRVVNYVLKTPSEGEWEVLFTKDIGTYLGDVTIQAAPMTGFLQINRADAKYTEGVLKVIWEAKGVTDDYCKVKVYARNGTTDILLYSGNTLDDGVLTVDMIDINPSKIAGNVYDIVIQITDIDVTASEPREIEYQFVTDEVIIENVEIPNNINNY